MQHPFLLKIFLLSKRSKQEIRSGAAGKTKQLVNQEQGRGPEMIAIGLLMSGKLQGMLVFHTSIARGRLWGLEFWVRPVVEHVSLSVVMYLKQIAMQFMMPITRSLMTEANGLSFVYLFQTLHHRIQFWIPSLERTGHHQGNITSE
jgi:hypothetical protein